MQKSIKEDIKFLEGKLEKNPDSILFARLADAYLQADRIDAAIELCENGIKKHPFYVTGHYVLAKIYLKKKLFDQAEKELKRVLLFDPKFIAAHRDYGELMSHIGWSNSCEMSYEAILHIDAFNEQARLRLKELKEHAPAHREPRKETPSEVEYDMAEENILDGVGQDIEAEAPLQEKIEPEKKYVPPADSRSFYPPESTIDFEDEQANLDMLEDIFRDDGAGDLILDEESEKSFKPKQHQKPGHSFDIKEPKFLSGNAAPEAKYDEFESDDFDGLEDDEILTIMSNEKEQTKQESEPFTPEPGRTPQKKSEPPKPSLPEEKIDRSDSDKRKEKIVTPTLGEIYAAQQQYTKAIGVYEILRKKDPNNDLYRQKIEYLQKKLEESQEN